MQRNEIIEMARQVGLCRTQSNFNDWIDAGPSGYELEEFAKLVMKNDLLRLTTLAEMLSNAQAVEREECAKVCEKQMEDSPWFIEAAAAIRARGEA